VRIEFVVLRKLSYKIKSELVVISVNRVIVYGKNIIHVGENKYIAG